MKRKVVLYARVSTNKQRRDLENQIELLKQFCLNNGWTIDGIYKDITSALDFDSQKDFNALLKDVLNYRIEKVVITYKDRLTRTGFNFFENLFRAFGAEIVVVNNYTDEKSDPEELMEEIFTLLHSFSMKFYSRRRKIKKCLEAALHES